MSVKAKSIFQLAHAQLDGGVPWGEIIIGSSTLCVCQHCGQEFYVAERCDPCAFCNDCKDDVLDKLAVGVVRFEPRAPRGKRTKAKRRARSR